EVAAGLAARLGLDHDEIDLRRAAERYDRFDTRRRRAAAPGEPAARGEECGQYIAFENRPRSALLQRIQPVADDEGLEFRNLRGFHRGRRLFAQPEPEECIGTERDEVRMICNRRKLLPAEHLKRHPPSPG